MAVAVFDYAAWLERYPEFTGTVSEGMAVLLFEEAGFYLSNTDRSPVQSASMRLILLNMVVAHLAALSGALEEGGKPSGMVGRVTEATEGSVTVKVDAGLAAGTAVWWGQTSYGFAFWTATRRYRTARYIAPVQPSFEPFGARLWRR